MKRLYFTVLLFIGAIIFALNALTAEFEWTNKEEMLKVFLEKMNDFARAWFIVWLAIKITGYNPVKL